MNAAAGGWKAVPVLKNVDDVSVKDIAYKYVESTTGIVLVPSTKGGSTEISYRFPKNGVQKILLFHIVR